MSPNEPAEAEPVAHTPGPLSVRISPEWPFDIETLNAQGEVVFVRALPAHSTKHKTPKDALNAVGLPPEWAQANHLALADEILRAAAPDLATALQALLVTARKQHEALQALLGIIADASGAEIPGGSIESATQAFEDMDEVKGAVAALLSAGLR